MNKKDEFKEFVKKHPNLVNSVKDKKYTWQDLYEVYDMYGEDNSVWQKYEEDDDRAGTLAELSNIVKNINMDSIQKHIGNAQKVISVIEELTTKKPVSAPIKVPTNIKPINKFFGD